MPRVLYRFSRDLRIDDHAGLAEAAKQGEIVPVLLLDPQNHERISLSPRRAAFFCSAVAALDEQLRERGSRLIVRRGAAGSALKAIARATNSKGVVWSASYDRFGMQSDERLQSALEEAGLRATIVHDAPALPPEDTTLERSAGGEGYRAFVPYFEVWRGLAVGSYDSPLLLHFASLDLLSEGLPSGEEFRAGEQQIEAGPNLALARLRDYLSASALQYSVAANVPADERTSQLSSDLSFGTIAARTVVRETLKRCDDPFLLTEERVSLKLFLRSLAMRDFFLQLSWYNSSAGDSPLQEKMREFTFEQSHPGLAAWRSGETGYPLVDAGVRQLHATGWMHPRVRVIAASFLCFDLGVDWRVGRSEWDKYLVEDDPALAVGNWQWIAAVGADLAAYPRIYNPRKQARRFDPQGRYIRRWVPELAMLSSSNFAVLRQPSDQIELPLFSGGYPQPIIDHEAAAREFLARYSAHVKRPEFSRPPSR